MKKRLRIQARIPGMRRDNLPSSLLPRIAERVQKEADRYGVSKSFVIAVALAHTFNIKEQEEY